MGVACLAVCMASLGCSRDERLAEMEERLAELEQRHERLRSDYRWLENVAAESVSTGNSLAALEQRFAEAEKFRREYDDALSDKLGMLSLSVRSLDRKVSELERESWTRR